MMIEDFTFHFSYPFFIHFFIHADRYERCYMGRKSRHILFFKIITQNQIKYQKFSFFN